MRLGAAWRTRLVARRLPLGPPARDRRPQIVSRSPRARFISVEPDGAHLGYRRQGRNTDCGSRLAPTRTMVYTMKTQLETRPFMVVPVRAVRMTEFPREGAGIDPRSRPRPFLVQTLPLRSRKPARS